MLVVSVIIFTTVILCCASLNVPRKLSREPPTVYIPDDVYKPRGESKDMIDFNNQFLSSKTSDSNQKTLLIKKRDNIGVNEDIDTAASNNNYEYRPLYVYRKIEHSKRRITMYNSFAG